jgi:hypothetical protein
MMRSVAATLFSHTGNKRAESWRMAAQTVAWDSLRRLKVARAGLIGTSRVEEVWQAFKLRQFAAKATVPRNNNKKIHLNLQRMQNADGSCSCCSLSPQSKPKTGHTGIISPKWGNDTRKFANRTKAMNRRREDSPNFLSSKPNIAQTRVSPGSAPNATHTANLDTTPASLSGKSRKYLENRF